MLSGFRFMLEHFGEWSVKNVTNLMYILKCFQMESGLKVNIDTSRLFGIEVDREEVEEWADLLDCRFGVVPFVYLGLPVWSSTRNKEHWRPVIEKFDNRLADRKARLISFGGRLTLVKSVLGSLPLFFLSLFRAQYV